ncbi:multidrug DMT transporter permease [Persicobacter psychrovividus]
MIVPSSYLISVLLCVITMFCWGSWANTQKLVSKSWPFPLFYWDYALGILILTFLSGMTFGSYGEVGRSFLSDLQQGDLSSFVSAFIGGVVFNLANLLIVAAISLAGMAVAFPVGIGIALVLGVIINYMAAPVGNATVLFTGVAMVTVAIILDAVAYGKLPNQKAGSMKKGLLLSVFGGVLMGFFFRFVAASVSNDFVNPTAGLFTPYSAVFIFSIGVFVSNFLWNSWFMYKPIDGEKSRYSEYFSLGSSRIHLIGILGGVIWAIGMGLSMIASEKAGFAISYGLGQGATMVAAAWGVFIWKEFKGAPKGVNLYIFLMFAFFISGLALIIASRFV